MHAFATDPIAELLLAFQDEDAGPAFRHTLCQSRSRQTAANND
jgi:hypothetical protein